MSDLPGLWTTGQIGSQAEEREAYSLAPATTGEVLGAAAGQAVADNPSSRLGRFINRNLMAPGRETELSVEDANARFGVAGRLTFDQPTSEAVARDLSEHHQAAAAREAVLARRQPERFGQGGLALFGAGVAGSIIDPLNIASAFIPFLPEARVAAMVANSARGARIAAMAGRGVVEGALGAAVLEPLNLGLARLDHDDYSMGDALTNIAFGAALGGVLHGAVAALRPIRGNLPADAHDAALREALVATAEGRPVAAAAAAEVQTVGAMRRDLADWARQVVRDAEQANPNIRDTTGLIPDAAGLPAVLYHGTTANVREFDPAALGRNTGAPSAEQGFFFTNRPKTADYYAAGESGNLTRAMEDSARQLKNAERDARVYEGTSQQSRADEAARKAMLGGGPNVIPVHLEMRNPFEHDFKGRVFRDETYNDIIQRAKAAGHDGVILRNTYDAGEYGRFDAIMSGRFKSEDIYVVFDKSQIRSAIEQRAVAHATKAIFDAEQAAMGDVAASRSNAPQPIEAAERRAVATTTDTAPKVEGDVAKELVEIEKQIAEMEAGFKATEPPKVEGQPAAVTPEMAAIERINEQAKLDEGTAKAFEAAAACAIQSPAAPVAVAAAKAATPAPPAPRPPAAPAAPPRPAPRSSSAPGESVLSGAEMVAQARANNIHFEATVGAARMEATSTLHTALQSGPVRAHLPDGSTVTIVGRKNREFVTDTGQPVLMTRMIPDEADLAAKLRVESIAPRTGKTD